MTDEATKKPDLKVVPEEELDEEEKEFRALRRDIPGVKGAADAGMLTISVGRQITPKNEFYRTHKTFRPVVPLVNIEVGMDQHYIAVMPNMVEPLASMGITVADHTLYLTITPTGALRIIPVRCPNAEGEQNEGNGVDRGHGRLEKDVHRQGKQCLQKLSGARRPIWRAKLARHQARQDHPARVQGQRPPDRLHRSHPGAEMGRT